MTKPPKSLLVTSIISPLQSYYFDKAFGFSGGSDSKESACKAGDPGLIPGSVRCPGEENGNLLQYSCLENYMEREAWQDPWGHKESQMSKYR